MNRSRRSRVPLALCALSPILVLMVGTAIFVLTDDEDAIPELTDPTTFLIRLKKDGMCVIQGRQYCDFKRPDAQGDYLRVLENMFESRRHNTRYSQGPKPPSDNFVKYRVVIETHPGNPFGYLQTLLSTMRFHGGVRYVTLTDESNERVVRLDFGQWAALNDDAVRIRMRVEDTSSHLVVVGGTEIGILNGGPEDRSVLKTTAAELLIRRPARVVVDADESIPTWDVLRLLETLSESGISGIDVAHDRLVERDR